MKNLYLVDELNISSEISSFLSSTKHKVISWDEYSQRLSQIDDIYLVATDRDLSSEKVPVDSFVLVSSFESKKKILDKHQVLAVFDISQKEEVKNLNHLLRFFKNHVFTSFFKDELVELNIELKQTRHLLDIELQRVKLIHEELAPHRFKQFKNVEISTRFVSGESIGGEFFDVVEDGKKILLYLAATKTYMSSTAVMTHFLNLKKSKNLEIANLDSFLKDLHSELKVIGDDATDTTEILLMLIDTASMQVEGYSFGGHLLLNQTTGHISLPSNSFLPGNIAQGHFDFTLERDDSLFVLSSGFTKNREAKDEVIKYTDAIDSNETNADNLNELIYQIKKDYLDDFMPFDSTVISLGVKKNALIGF